MGTIIVITVAAIIALLVWLLYFGAKYEKQTCYVPTGEIKFVVAGESCVKVLPNLDGTNYHYDYDTGLTVEGERGIIYPPHSILGVYLVSLLYPLKEIHVYQYEWDKLRKGDPTKGEKDYVIDHHPLEYVNSLYLFYTYPILAEEVELEGNLRINILVNVTFRMVNPILVVFVFKAKWPRLVNATVKGAIATFGQGKTLDAFRKEDKEGGDSAFSMAVKQINDSTNNMPGIIENYGVAVHAVDFVSYDPVIGSPEEQKAITALEIARLEADADTERARGITVIGTARAEALGARLKIASDHDGGTGVLQQEIFTDGLEKFKGDILSLGGDRMPLAITQPQSKPKIERI